MSATTPCRQCGTEVKTGSIYCHHCKAFHPTRNFEEEASAADAATAGPLPAVALHAIDLPFWDLVVLLVKLSFAAIPAVIIVALVWALVGGMLAGLFAY